MNGELVHDRGAGFVEADDFDLGAVAAKFEHDLVERAHGGQIPEVRVADIDVDAFQGFLEIKRCDKRAGRREPARGWIRKVSISGVAPHKVPAGSGSIPAVRAHCADRNVFRTGQSQRQQTCGEHERGGREQAPDESAVGALLEAQLINHT